MSTAQNHFWSGCLCYIMSGKGTVFPERVIAGSDVVLLTADLGNQIPDKSWMLYLFELFVDKKRNIPLELNIICQFDNQNYFEAIFGGHNQYRFRKVLPEVGHAYSRKIFVDPTDHVIYYHLSDIQSKEHESFKLHEGNIRHPFIELRSITLEGSRQFSGIEWWNKISTHPYPIRYQVQISLLKYARDESSTQNGIRYLPYQIIVSDTDRQGQQYPISLVNPRVMDGCICYNVDAGSSRTGLTYPHPPQGFGLSLKSVLRKMLQ
jgi:hypothetical protein